MRTNTKIEWCDHTWNPWYGCPDDGKRTPGCANCFARDWATRFKSCDFDREVKRASDKSFYAPLNRRKFKPGEKVFVCDLSDFVHPAVPEDLRWEAFGVIASRPDLTWLFLTKRPEYISPVWAMIEDGTRGRYVAPALCENAGAKLSLHGDGDAAARFYKAANRVAGTGSWPMRNWWLGVTVENQEQADKRIPILLQTPAAKRFVSVEPMLGAVDLIPYMGGRSYRCKCEKAWHHTEINRLMPHGKEARCVECGEYAEIFPTLDWVICGGESGPKARPMHPDWVRSLRDQCAETGTLFLFKQWGEWSPKEDQESRSFMHACGYVHPFGEAGDKSDYLLGGWAKSGETLEKYGFCWMERVGKHRAGRLLDGVEHLVFPD